MSRFIASVNEPFTRTVSLGPCECPGSPHKEDSAEVYRTLGWDDLYDVGEAARESSGAGMRTLVTRALASWTLVEMNGDGTAHPVPIVESTVRLLDQATVELIVTAANEAYEKARTPLPNASGEASPRSSEDTPSTPTKTAKPTS